MAQPALQNHFPVLLRGQLSAMWRLVVRLTIEKDRRRMNFIHWQSQMTRMNHKCQQTKKPCGVTKENCPYSTNDKCAPNEPSQTVQDSLKKPNENGNRQNKKLDEISHWVETDRRAREQGRVIRTCQLSASKVGVQVHRKGSARKTDSSSNRKVRDVTFLEDDVESERSSSEEEVVVPRQKMKNKNVANNTVKNKLKTTLPSYDEH